MSNKKIKIVKKTQLLQEAQGVTKKELKLLQYDELLEIAGLDRASLEIFIEELDGSARHLENVRKDVARTGAAGGGRTEKVAKELSEETALAIRKLARTRSEAKKALEMLRRQEDLIRELYQTIEDAPRPLTAAAQKFEEQLRKQIGETADYLDNFFKNIRSWDADWFRFLDPKRWPGGDASGPGRDRAIREKILSRSKSRRLAMESLEKLKDLFWRWNEARKYYFSRASSWFKDLPRLPRTTLPAGSTKFWSRPLFGAKPPPGANNPAHYRGAARMAFEAARNKCTWANIKALMGSSIMKGYLISELSWWAMTGSSLTGAIWNRVNEILSSIFSSADDPDAWEDRLRSSTLKLGDLEYDVLESICTQNPTARDWLATVEADLVAQKPEWGESAQSALYEWANDIGETKEGLEDHLLKMHEAALLLCRAAKDGQKKALGDFIKPAAERSRRRKVRKKALSKLQAGECLGAPGSALKVGDGAGKRLPRMNWKISNELGKLFKGMDASRREVLLTKVPIEWLFKPTNGKWKRTTWQSGKVFGNVGMATNDPKFDVNDWVQGKQKFSWAFVQVEVDAYNVRDGKLEPPSRQRHLLPLFSENSTEGDPWSFGGSGALRPSEKDFKDKISAKAGNKTALAALAQKVPFIRMSRAIEPVPVLADPSQFNVDPRVIGGDGRFYVIAGVQPGIIVKQNVVLTDKRIGFEVATSADSPKLIWVRGKPNQEEFNKFIEMTISTTGRKFSEDNISRYLVDSKGRSCKVPAKVKDVDLKAPPKKAKKDTRAPLEEGLLLERRGGGCRLNLKQKRSLGKMKPKIDAARKKLGFKSTPTAPKRAPTPTPVKKAPASVAPGARPQPRIDPSPTVDKKPPVDPNVEKSAEAKAKVDASPENRKRNAATAPSADKAKKVAPRPKVRTATGKVVEIPIDLYDVKGSGWPTVRTRIARMNAGYDTKFAIEEIVEIGGNSTSAKRFTRALASGYGKKAQETVVKDWLGRVVRGVVVGIFATKSYLAARLAIVASKLYKDTAMLGMTPLGMFVTAVDLLTVALEVAVGPNCHSVFIMHHIGLGLTPEEECAMQDAERERDEVLQKLKENNSRGEHYLNLYFAGDGADGLLRPWRPGDGVLPRGAMNQWAESTKQWSTPGISPKIAELAASTKSGPVYNPKYPARRTNRTRKLQNHRWTYFPKRENRKRDYLFHWLNYLWIRHVSGHSLDKANFSTMMIRGNADKWAEIPGWFGFTKLPNYKKIVLIAEKRHPKFLGLANDILSGDRNTKYFEALQEAREFIQKQSDATIKRLGFTRLQKIAFSKTRFSKDAARWTETLKQASADKDEAIPFWLYMIAKITATARGGISAIPKSKLKATRKKAWGRAKGDRTGADGATLGTAARPWPDASSRATQLSLLMRWNGRAARGSRRYVYVVDPRLDTQRFMIGATVGGKEGVGAGVYQDSEGNVITSAGGGGAGAPTAMVIVHRSQLNQKLRGMWNNATPQQWIDYWNELGESQKFRNPPPKPRGSAMKTKTGESFNQRLKRLRKEVAAEQARKLKQKRAEQAERDRKAEEEAEKLMNQGGNVSPSGEVMWENRQKPILEWSELSSEKTTIDWETLMEAVGPAPAGKGHRFYDRARQNRLRWNKLSPITARVRTNARGEWDPASKYFGLRADEVEAAKAGTLRYVKPKEGEIPVDEPGRTEPVAAEPSPEDPRAAILRKRKEKEKKAKKVQGPYDTVDFDDLKRIKPQPAGTEERFKQIEDLLRPEAGTPPEKRAKLEQELRDWGEGDRLRRLKLQPKADEKTTLALAKKLADRSPDKKWAFRKDAAKEVAAAYKKNLVKKGTMPPSLSEKIKDEASRLAVRELGAGAELTDKVLARFVDQAAKNVVANTQSALKKQAEKGLKGRQKRTIDYDAVSRSAREAFLKYGKPGSENYNPELAQKMFEKANRAGGMKPKKSLRTSR